MNTLKAVGYLMLAAVFVSAIGGCKSKEPAKQDMPDTGSVSKSDAVPSSKPGLSTNVVTPKKPDAGPTSKSGLGDTASPTATLPATSSAPAPAKELTLDLGNKITMKLTLIPAGKFMMGSPADEKGRFPDEGLPAGRWVNGSPQCEMTISNPFYMGIYNVTVDQYEQFMKDTGHGQTYNTYKEMNCKITGDYPVLGVIPFDAIDFCEWLSKKTSKEVTLPSEKQWEYACRAGSKTRFSYGDDNDYANLGDYAWYKKNSDGKPHPVGQKKPNDWGLYDMHGNVWQWCLEATKGMGSGQWRGGSWYSDPQSCRSAFRGYFTTNVRPCDMGFRVIVDLK